MKHSAPLPRKRKRNENWRRNWITVISIWLLSMTNGCSTINAHRSDHDILHPYLGTKSAVSHFYNSFFDYTYYNEATVRAVDIPFCFVADTILIPYDTFIWSKRQSRSL
jgi:uncharacterized protein YceK